VTSRLPGADGLKKKQEADGSLRPYLKEAGLFTVNAICNILLHPLTLAKI
jgi:hypothetical protein